MQTPTPSCDEFDPQALDLGSAQQRILAAIKPIQRQQSLPLQAALGRILASDVVARIAVPNFSNAAMDGYALRYSDLSSQQQFVIAGSALAGHPYTDPIDPGQAIRITTGAALPESLDTVIMQEWIDVSHDHHITIRQPTPRPIQQGDHIRHPGEDIRIGQTLLSSGQYLSAAELGLLAAQGITSVNVWQRLRVAYFSTGDELTAAGATLDPGGIYDSNRSLLFGLLSEMNIECIDLGIVKDEPAALATSFATAAASADVVISTGGVSIGDSDFVKQILQQQGRLNFWKIAMRPGRPFSFGQLGDSHFFGLPGNPVAVMVSFDQLVRPALQQLAGARPTSKLQLRAISLSHLKKPKGRRDFQRGLLSQNNHGELQVRTTGLQGSHVLSSMSQANCYIMLPEDCTEAAVGQLVDVIPFTKSF